jgi:hypothetical protein
VGFSQGFTPCLPAAAAEFTANVSSPPPGVAENMRGTCEKKMTRARRVLVFSPRIRLRQHTRCVRLARADYKQNTRREITARVRTQQAVFSE